LSKPPSETKKICRVTPRAWRAAIIDATECNWLASGLLAGQTPGTGFFREYVVLPFTVAVSYIASETNCPTSRALSMMRAHCSSSRLARTSRVLATKSACGSAPVKFAWRSARGTRAIREPGSIAPST
jgi:hypothetical protein